MDGIPEKQVNIRMEYVKEKVTFVNAASNRGKQFHFLLHSNLI